jgi:uncharacterized membrane protein
MEKSPKVLLPVVPGAILSGPAVGAAATLFMGETIFALLPRKGRTW